MRRARGEMNRAIARGDLVRGSCELADGSCSTRIIGHHDDYSKPLDVRWQSQRHHVLLHRA